MPKNMKYDATTKKAGAPKKMKSNQDGGSVTAKDPSAAGKQLMADQKGAAKYKKGPAMGHKKGPAKYDRVVLGGNKGDVSKTKPGKKDYDGSAKMGYSQKFGPGRMNGYDTGAKKVMDVMTFGAGKYMAEGPGQGRFDEMNERLRKNKEQAATNKAIEKQRNITQMQADVKDGTRSGFKNPSKDPVDGSTYTYSQRLMLGGDKMIDPASDYTRNVTRGKDGYYKGDAFPKNRQSDSSRDTYSYTDDRTKNKPDINDYQSNYQRRSFDFAKMDYERKAASKAKRLNAMIDKEKRKQGINPDKERAQSIQKNFASRNYRL